MTSAHGDFEMLQESKTIGRGSPPGPACPPASLAAEPATAAAAAPAPAPPAAEEARAALLEAGRAMLGALAKKLEANGSKALPEGFLAATRVAAFLVLHGGGLAIPDWPAE